GSISAPILGPRAGEFILTDAGPTSASAFEWFVDSVVSRADGGRRDRDALFDFCNKEVARTRAGDATPYFLPYLNGRLDEPQARGCFIGLASWHGLPEMVRAIYEGVAFEHRGHVDHLLNGRARPRAADLPAARRAVSRGSRFSPQPSSCRSSLLEPTNS